MSLHRIFSMNFRLVMNIRTISSIHKGFDFMNTRFFILIRFYVGSRFSPAPFIMPFGEARNLQQG